MDDNLKDKMQNLGLAINKAVSNSQEIDEAIADIKGSGYEAYIVLELTIAFEKIGGQNDQINDDNPDKPQKPSSGRSKKGFKLTANDRKWLGEMKINLGDDESKKT